MVLKHLVPFGALLGLALAQQEQIPLTNAPYLPNPDLLGFGTWNLKGQNATDAVSYAIQTGYRHIDGATAYGNEDYVGAGIADGLKKAGINRNEIWVTSKLWNDHHAPHLVPKALDKTLSDLGLDYIDLWHMHWPVSAPPSTKSNEIYYLDTWRAMSSLLSTGKVRFIGISNFDPGQLETLLNQTDVKPHVHQMELHPYLQQNDWVAYHQALGIHVTAYSPLGGTNPTYGKKAFQSGIDAEDLPTPLLQNEVVLDVAGKRNCTPAQVVLEWGRRRATSVIPKSSHKERIKENWGAPACKLKSEDLIKITELGSAHHRYNNPSGSWKVPLYDGLEGV